MKKRILSFVLAAVMAFSMLALAGCSATPPTPSTGDPAKQEEKITPTAVGAKAEDIKVGFVYIGPIGDEGWTYAQDQGRMAIEKDLGIKTTYIESVAENKADCTKAINTLIDQGCNVVVTCSYGYMDATFEAASKNPEVIFMHCSGYKTAENMSAYFGRAYQSRYLAGITAGLNTQNNKIGYVAAMQIPEVIRGINAFTLGAKSVNPDATVEVLWTNTWYDPALEKSAATELLNKGCDLIAQHQDTTGPQVAAEEKGAKCIGYNTSTPTAAPNGYLTAPIWDLGIYFKGEIEKMMDGSWTSSNFWGGLETGVTLLDDLTANCAPGTQEAVDEAKAKIVAGDEKVFEGPIKDNEGTERVKEGQALTDEEMLALDWFVEGVIGKAK